MAKRTTKRINLTAPAAPTYCDLTVGTRVWYTGDICNHEGEGEIIEAADCDWYVKSYTVRMDDGRTFRLTPSAFRPYPGRRFWPKAERDAYWEEVAAQLKARAKVA
mgnify:CR=1 FL=1